MCVSPRQRKHYAWPSEIGIESLQVRQRLKPGEPDMPERVLVLRKKENKSIFGSLFLLSKPATHLGGGGGGEGLRGTANQKKFLERF